MLGNSQQGCPERMFTLHMSAKKKKILKTLLVSDVQLKGWLMVHLSCVKSSESSSTPASLVPGFSHTEVSLGILRNLIQLFVGHRHWFSFLSFRTLVSKAMEKSRMGPDPGSFYTSETDGPAWGRLSLVWVLSGKWVLWTPFLENVQDRGPSE